jgi:hypothetical protein
VVVPALVALALSYGLAAELTVTSPSGELLVGFDLSEEAGWCVLWNHSVAGFDVRDCYRYEEGAMLLTSHHTPDFAAGLGHLPGRGRLESDGHGGYVIEDIDEPVPGNRYLLRVGSPAVNHRIAHGGAVVSLSELAAGERVMIAVRSCQPREEGPR